MIDGESPLVAYSVSTAVGSGKTRAAIQYIAAPENIRQNFLYVAPTIRLIEQTAKNLRKVIEEIRSERDVELIHSESRKVDGIPVAVETTETINNAAPDAGMAVIISTVTFLRILSEIHAPEHWRVIIDEGFSPVDFLKVHLGKRADDGLDHFLSVFAIEPDERHSVVPAHGQNFWVQELASGNHRRAGDKFIQFQELAQAVMNPVRKCDLVMSPKTHAILARTHVDKPVDGEAPSRVAAESVLLIAAYVSPDAFRRFGEVIFMSALFERTLLNLMWTKLFGVTFIQHSAFAPETLRNIHADQGMLVEIGHLLHEEDRTSKHNLQRNIETGASGETEPGLRVIDRLVQLSADHFRPARFLLQTNNGYGYVNGAPLMPLNAERIPASSHGLNEFQDYDKVAALAITNPNPQETRWIMDMTGLDIDQTLTAFRIHTTYQAVGRSSIRKGDPTNDRKTFLTAGSNDAWLLHQIFEGSTWLGQIGDLKSLAQMSMAAKADTLEGRLAFQVWTHLDNVAESVDRVSSRSIKAALGTTCSSSTWTRAVGLAAEDSNGWELEGQSFVRRDAASYGFIDEDAGEDDEELVPEQTSPF